MDYKKLFSRNKKMFAASVFMGVMPFVSGYLLIHFSSYYEEGISTLHYSEKAILYAALMVALPLGMLPTTFLSVFGGYFWGWESLFYMVPAYLGATLIGYGIGKKIDGGSLISTLSEDPKTLFFIEQLNQKKWWVTFFSRLSPVLPFAVTNMVLSASKIPLFTYASATLCGMLPRTVLATWAGIHAFKIRQSFSQHTFTEDYQIGLGVLLIISVTALYLLFRKSFQKT